jgi:hypothetical protein
MPVETRRLPCAAFARHLREHDLHAFGALLPGADQRRDVLRVDQRLVGQRDDHRVELAGERRQAEALRRDLPVVGLRVAHHRHREGLHHRLDEPGVVAEHDHDLVDTGARQRDELAADQRHAAELEQALRLVADARAAAGGQQHGADDDAAVEPAAAFEDAAHGQASWVGRFAAHHHSMRASQ